MYISSNLIIIIRIGLSIIKLLYDICRIMYQRKQAIIKLNNMNFQMKKALNARLLRLLHQRR